jgi:sulfotransferase 6B1
LLMAALDSFPGVRSAGLHLMKRRVLLDDSDVPERNSHVDWKLVRNLLDRAAKNGQYVTSHIWGHDELFEILDELGYVSFFVIRDPRDIVVSNVAYITRLRRHRHHRRFVSEFQNDTERYLALINGFPRSHNGFGGLPLRERLEGYLPWLTSSVVMCCRFEDLVGERGGGSSRAQVGTVLDIGRHIGRPVTAPQAARIATNAWSPRAATFRAGVIGEWRHRFDQSTLDAFQGSIGAELLSAYGYGS